MREKKRNTSRFTMLNWKKMISINTRLLNLVRFGGVEFGRWWRSGNGGGRAVVGVVEVGIG